MMLLAVAAAIVASLAVGVTLAYGLCSALLTVFRLHARAARPAPLPMRTKTARP